MKEYIKGFFKNNFKKNVSLLSLVDEKSCISSKSKVSRLCKLKNVTLGDYSYISKGADINNCNIGKYCSIAPGVKIGFGIHPTDYISTSPLFYTDRNIFGYAISRNNTFIEFKESNIGNDVWIGLNAIVMDGINIGDGAIIGAGAVVTKDVEPYTIVGGVPAKFIRNRFENSIKDELLMIKWWNFSENEIDTFKDTFFSPKLFLDKYNKNTIK